MNRDDLLSKRLHHQYLTRPCQDHLLLAEAACDLQAQYYNNVYYSLIIRCGNQRVDGWDQNLLKTWTLRGTLHAVPPKDLSLGFDPLIIGYKEHDLILEAMYLREIIILTGIIKPAIMLNGKICGRWSIKKNVLNIEMFKPLDTKIKRLLSEYALNLFDGIVLEVAIQS